MHPRVMSNTFPACRVAACVHEYHDTRKRKPGPSFAQVLTRHKRREDLNVAEHDAVQERWSDEHDERCGRAPGDCVRC